MLDDQNRASSTASSRTGDRHPVGDALEIHQSADPHALSLIQTVPDGARNAAGVPQTEPAEGLGDRPSSMPANGLRRTAGAQNVVSQDASERIAVGQAGVSQTGRDWFQRVRAWDENLHLPGAPGAKAGQFQTVSSAEIRGAVRAQADR
jgi:hypothetical protein